MSNAKVICRNYHDGEFAYENDVPGDPSFMLSLKRHGATDKGWVVTEADGGFDAVKQYPGYTPSEKRREFRIVED